MNVMTSGATTYGVYCANTTFVTFALVHMRDTQLDARTGARCGAQASVTALFAPNVLTLSNVSMPTEGL
ncbi:hypothetical protein Pelo_18199 [Pelomyxa schiedti]|nr:hypothetical protein Pelo_18199 [Pelomyxa schiedti]